MAMNEERELLMVAAPWDPAISYWYAVRDLYQSLDAARHQVNECRRLRSLADDNMSGPVPAHGFFFNDVLEKIRLARVQLPQLPETYARIDGGCTLPDVDATTGVL
jgi:hypothetical protein